MKSPISALALGASLALVPAQAWAEEAAAEGEAPASVETIIVIGQAEEIGRLTTASPIAGSNLSREDLLVVQPSDTLREFMRRVPGVSMVRNFRIPIGGKGYMNNLVDGYSLKSSSLGTMSFLEELNLWDVENIEITRGPGSVLYSSKGIGATINVYTRDIAERPEFGLSAEGGEHGFTRFVGYATAPVTENLGVTLTASHHEEDGWRERTGKNKEAVSGKIIFRPDSATKITLRGEYVEGYREYPGTLTRAQFDADWRQAIPQNLFENLKYQTLMAAVKRNLWQGGEIDLAYVYHRNYGINACPSGCSNSVASTGRETDIDYRNHNLRGVFRQDLGWLDSRLYLGVDAILSTEDDETFNRSGFTRGTLRTAYRVKETNIAPFAELSVTPISGLRLTGGLRYETFEIDVDDRSPASNRDGVKKYDSLIAKLGATYEIAPNHRIWANVSEGFYLPGTAQTLTGTNPRDLPPERSLTYQIGVRGTLPDNRLGYDIGIYHTTIRGQGLSLLCGGNTTLCPEIATGTSTYPAAAGKVRYQGIEASAFYQPVEALRLSLAYTHARNRFVDFVDNSGNYSGNDNAASPRHHLNGRVLVRPMKGLQAELEADYISAYFTNTANTDRYKRPVLANLHASYDLTSVFRINLHLLNLFNARHADRISSTNAVVPVRSYSEGHQPFTLRAGVTAKW